MSTPSHPPRSATDAGLPAVSPDIVEQDSPEKFDNIVPTRGYQMLPMVGLGGSAGSIVALQDFFATMPADSGMVFVVIIHLSPVHESSLAELLSRHTAMPVVQATDGLIVQANHVYVIPPGKDLTVLDGFIRLNPLEPERGKRVVVDLFFRSLADTYGPHATAIVLSGADGDGALGIKRIKERGGLTLVQDPDEAEHPSMPRTAIDTGMVDWVMRVREIPPRLLEFALTEKKLKLPPEEGPQPALPEPPSPDQSETALREVLVFLRTSTGRDFSYYKRATILRRVARRMQVNGLEDIPSYLVYLRMHPGEAGALLQDLLISVTNFFRDRDAFAAAEALIPQLFKGKSQSDAVRIWVPACATGEEAYSFAMLLLEHARTLDAPPALQVFACDLDEEAIAKARAGLFPDAMVADVSEERVRKFFHKEQGGYRVRRELREMVLFAAHDLLKDAPFSRMDLVSCRNLLIYLNRDAQNRAFATFHFSLRPGGLLFLGTSESIDESTRDFRIIDKKHRIYAQVPSGRIATAVPLGASALLRSVEAQERSGNSPVVHSRRFLQEALTPFPSTPIHAQLDRSTLAEVHFKLLERLAPPSVIVNIEHDVVHLSESAGRFLRLTGGEPTANLLRLVDPLVGGELRAALNRSAESGLPVEVVDLPLQLDGRSRLLDLRVAPAPDVAAGFMLVVFAVGDAKVVPAGEPTGRTVSDEPVVLQLERELEQNKSHLRDTVEQYEASNEEMKASNEELQAMNEELRSATEELETSREELQSINEELSTVNTEMKAKVDELANTYSDLQNLMASTSIATVFLDRDLAIKRYTPSAVDLFHLIPGDLGRPLAHLRHRLNYPEIISDCEQVLKTLVPREREVGDETHWYLARLQPYRTLEDMIAGVVLTFVDITQSKRTENALRSSEENLGREIEDLKRLRAISSRLVRDDAVDELYAEILATATALMKSDWASLQRLDRATGEFRLIAIDGFALDALTVDQRFSLAADPTWRPALERGERIIEADLQSERIDTEVRQQHARSGAGAQQSTPLLTRDGTLVGILSTQWKHPHQPGERELRMLDLLTRQVADMLERSEADEQLREQMNELQRFNTMAVGRETRMIELKKELNSLRVRLGEPPRYARFDEDGNGD